MGLVPIRSFPKHHHFSCPFHPLSTPWPAVKFQIEDLELFSGLYPLLDYIYYSFSLFRTFLLFRLNLDMSSMEYENGGGRFDSESTRFSILGKALTLYSLFFSDTADARYDYRSASPRHNERPDRTRSLSPNAHDSSR